MDIPYASRSKFIFPCKEAIVAQRKALDGGQTISVNLAPGGYSDVVKVTIVAASHEFQAQWNGKDITRFPARIKAAATALRDAGETGEFRISHDNGLLSITNL